VTIDDYEALIMQRLSDEVPGFAPDQARTERRRNRCRARLEQHRSGVTRSDNASASWIAARALIGVLCAIYLSAVVTYLVELSDFL
jgi:hypothetical protein